MQNKAFSKIWILFILVILIIIIGGVFLNCAKEGESPNCFNFTTGKKNFFCKHCCPGLKVIGSKTHDGIIMYNVGVPGICRPCGNGICDSEYEDINNCPEDCK